jgi:hypothetical protein
MENDFSDVQWVPEKSEDQLRLWEFLKFIQLNQDDHPGQLARVPEDIQGTLVTTDPVFEDLLYTYDPLRWARTPYKRSKFGDYLWHFRPVPGTEMPGLFVMYSKA